MLHLYQFYLKRFNNLKNILVHICSYILDKDRENKKSFNSQTHKTLNEHDFKISKASYKKFLMSDSLFVVKISW